LPPQALTQFQGQESITVSDVDFGAGGTFAVEVIPLDPTGSAETDQINIFWYGDPELNPINPIEVLNDFNSGDLDTYSIRVNVLGNGDYEYALNGGEFQDDPVFLDVPAGLNNVAINDKNGCGTIFQDVYVLGYPRFFTPNGSGPAETELWNIRGIDPSMPLSYTVFIFDRYGKLLKQMDETSQGWDGIYNGKPLPSSDYWFRVEFNRNDNGVVIATTSKSHFSLRR